MKEQLQEILSILNGTLENIIEHPTDSAFQIGYCSARLEEIIKQIESHGTK